jgi:hypothetical protein
MRAPLICGCGLPLLAIITLFAGISMHQIRGQAPSSPAPTAAAKPVHFLLHADPKTAGGASPSIAGCQQCHSGANTPGATEFNKYKSNEFILLNESIIWAQSDIHSQAYTNLTGKIGQQMQAVLGYDVAKDARCLVCHATDLTPLVSLSEKKLSEFATANDGINCTMCHGLGRNWQLDHFSTPVQAGEPMPWRAKPPTDKFAQGMSDLRNPATKAKLCVSCHVGNPAEGKIITHEMYAAGHPPLPPFELGHFMEHEPKHWGYPTNPKLQFFAEFAQKNPDKTWEIFRYHPVEKESYLARHVATGAIAALQAEMLTVAAEAKAAADPEGTTLVDYARFDCYACHHDLKYPSPRQQRGYSGPPGRPTLKAWVEALAGVIAEHAAGLDQPRLKSLAPEFTTKWQAVQKAAVARPFGAPKELAASASALADWCEQFLIAQTEIVVPVYPPSQAQRLQDMIIQALAERWSADPEAAMHLTWAYLTLRSEGKQPLSDAQQQAFNAVIPTTVRHPDHYSDRTKTPPRPKPIETYLKERLLKFAAFDDKKLRELLKSCQAGESPR